MPIGIEAVTQVMSDPLGSPKRCDKCGSSITSEPGLEIVLVRDGNELPLTFCSDCDEVACPTCGTHISFHSHLFDEHNQGQNPAIIRCDRCEEQTTVSDAIKLRHKNHARYRKIVCGDCFKQITVPSEYTVIRDFSPETSQ